MNKRGLTKKKAQKLHARRRFMQRKNIVFTRNMETNMIKRIQKNHSAKFLKRESCRVTIWEIADESGTYVVVYDKKRKSIVTVLS